MEGLTFTGAAIAMAIVLVVLVLQIVASAFGAIDPGAAF